MSASTSRGVTTYTLWTREPPERLAVDRLVAEAASVDLTALRRQALPYSGLSPWQGADRAFNSFAMYSDAVAITLSDPTSGRYVFTHLEQVRTPARSIGVWAALHGVCYLHPVRTDLVC